MSRTTNSYAPYRRIARKFWWDETIAAFPPYEKLLAAYLLTNSYLNRIGFYHLSKSVAREETGIPDTVWDTVWNTVFQNLKWVFDEQKSVVFLTGYFAHQGPDNEKAMKGFLKDLDDLPKTFLITEFFKEKQHIPEAWHSVWDAATIPYLQRYEKQKDTVSNTLSHTVPPQKKKQKQKLELKEKFEKESDLTVSSCVGDEVLLTFPCNGRIKNWNLTKTFLLDLESAFPGINILGESRKALAWVKVKGLKTSVGMPRFLYGWISRSNDGRSGGNGQASLFAPPPPRKPQAHILPADREQFKEKFGEEL